MRDLIKYLFQSAQAQGDNFLSIFYQANILQKDIGKQLEINGRMIAFTRAYFEGYPLHTLSPHQESVVKQVSNNITTLSNFRFNLLPTSPDLSDISTLDAARWLVERELECLLEANQPILHKLYYYNKQAQPASLRIIKPLLQYIKDSILNSCYLDTLAGMYLSVSEAFTTQYGLPTILKKEYLYYSEEFDISEYLMPITRLIYTISLTQVIMRDANLGILGKNTSHLQKIANHFVNKIAICLYKLDRTYKALGDKEDYIISLLNKVAKDLYEEFLSNYEENLEEILSDDDSYYSDISFTSSESENEAYHNSSSSTQETEHEEVCVRKSFLGIENLDITVYDVKKCAAHISDFNSISSSLNNEEETQLGIVGAISKIPELEDIFKEI